MCRSWIPSSGRKSRGIDGGSADAAHASPKTFPVEGRAGIDLVRLDVVVAEDALVGFQLVRWQDFTGDGAVGVAGEIGPEMGKDAGEGGGQFGEGGVLLRGEVVLDEVGALDPADDEFGPGGSADEAGGGEAGGKDSVGEGENDAGNVVGVPGFEAAPLGDGKGAGVGDFDSDTAGVGSGGVPGAFLEIEGLVEGAIGIQHEMDTEPAFVVKDLETATAGAGGIEVEDELVDAFPEIVELPSAAAHGLQLGGIQAVTPQAVAVG